MHLVVRRRPVTLVQALRRGAVNALAILLGGSVGVCVVALAGAAGVFAQNDVQSAHIEFPGSPSRIEPRGVREVRALFEAHDCWTGRRDIPADMRGRHPGHVIVTRSGADRPTYSAALVGPAMDQLFGSAGGDDLTVHAFCR